MRGARAVETVTGHAGFARRTHRALAERIANGEADLIRRACRTPVADHACQACGRSAELCGVSKGAGHEKHPNKTAVILRA